MNDTGGAVNAGRDDVEFLPRTPIYVPATVVFDNVAFRDVGLRLKGNSSLLAYIPARAAAARQALAVAR